MKIWLITDTHINHDMIVKYESRPVDFVKQIVDNWKTLVSPDDEVYHLGDVIFKKAGTLSEILASVPGTKHLCMGNHDNNKPDWYVKKGFTTARDYIMLPGGILLSHKPLEIALYEGATVNIHGHFHNSHRTDSGRNKEAYSFYSDNHKLLSIEKENYKPVLLEEFLNRK